MSRSFIQAAQLKRSNEKVHYKFITLHLINDRYSTLTMWSQSPTREQDKTPSNHDALIYPIQ